MISREIERYQIRTTQLLLYIYIVYVYVTGRERERELRYIIKREVDSARHTETDSERSSDVEA